MAYTATGLGESYDRRGPTNPSLYPRCVTAAQRARAHADCKPLTLRGLGLIGLSAANPCWVEQLPTCPPPPRRQVPQMRAVPDRTDWAALVKYAAAVKAQNDARDARLLAAAQAATNAKDAADMVAYARAVKAQNDKRVADLVAHANAVKAAVERPRAPGMREVPVRIPKPPPTPPPVPKPPAVIAADLPPPPAPPAPPVAEVEPEHPTEVDTPPPVEASMMSAGSIWLLVALVAAGGWYLHSRKKGAAAAA